MSVSFSVKLWKPFCPVILVFTSQDTSLDASLSLEHLGRILEHLGRILQHLGGGGGGIGLASGGPPRERSQAF
jgi:hypothetical protein